MSATAQSTAPPRTGASQADFPVDPNAPLFVAGAVLGSAVLGSATGAMVGVTRHMNPFMLGVNMGINCGVASLAFFGTREYLITPILSGMGATQAHERIAYEYSSRRRHARGEVVAPLPAPTLTEVRTTRLLDSAIAGAVSGGGMSLFFRGPRTIIPAAFTAGLIATAAQFAVNEARVFRLKSLTRQEKEAEAASELAGELEASSPVPMVEAPTIDSFHDPLKPIGEKRGDSPLSGRILSALSGLLPVRRLSDEEYLSTLENKRKEIIKRLEEIDVEQLAMFERSEALEAGEKRT